MHPVRFLIMIFAASQVHVNHFVEVLFLHADEEAVLGDARIVHEAGQIDLILDSFFEESLYAFRVAHIELVGRGHAVPGVNEFSHAHGFFRAAHIRQNNLITVPGQGEGCCPAYAAGTAGHKGRGGCLRESFHDAPQKIFHEQ